MINSLGHDGEMEGSSDSRRLDSLELATAEAARRMVTIATVIGVMTVAGTSVVAYIAYRAGRQEMAPWWLGLTLFVGLSVPLALWFLFRGYQVTQLSAMTIASSLRRSKARYRGLYHNSPIMMHSIDEEGHLVRVNNHWLTRLGYDRHAVIGHHLCEFLAEDSRRYAEEVGLPRFFKEGSCSEVPYRVVCRDGEVLDVLLSARTEHDDEGQFSNSLAILVDVTAQKQAEADRESVIRQLEQRNDELNRFTYTVSHDLKSPLVTIKGFLGYMKKDLGAGRTDRVGSDLDRVAEAAERMRELLDDLLELSRIGRIVNPPEEVELSDLAREAGEQVAGALDERGVTMEVSPLLPRVRCDRVRMLQVLQNLVENAVKFMGEQSDPKIEVGCRLDAGQSVCFVADNGVGLEEEHQEGIFELFKKIHPDQEGTGIGLALVRRIIEVHGGRVWVESRGLGTGSTFCFTLPMADGGPEESGILDLKALGSLKEL